MVCLQEQNKKKAHNAHAATLQRKREEVLHNVHAATLQRKCQEQVLLPCVSQPCHPLCVENSCCSMPTASLLAAVCLTTRPTVLMMGPGSNQHGHIL